MPKVLKLFRIPELDNIVTSYANAILKHHEQS